MAETSRLARTAPSRGTGSVALLRVAIILALFLIWEAVSASGLLYRDVVPSLIAIGRALLDLLGHAWHWR